jgi:phenylacetyl-CoA:acceptor oxidoreductase subunit 2
MMQTNWDARAALNFMCGGAGAGLMIAAALLGLPGAAVVLALALIGCGLGAVWLELGKPLRAAHVFFNPFTSWMARESLAAVLLFALGIAAFWLPQLVPAAAVAAAVFLWCQARMLHGGKGIPAWRARETVPLLVATGLAEGAGLALFFTGSALALALFAAAVMTRALFWARHPLAPARGAFQQVGTLAALALAIAATAFPPAAWLAGAAALATGWYLKFALVTRASLKQGFALPRLPVRGTR